MHAKVRAALPAIMTAADLEQHQGERLLTETVYGLYELAMENQRRIVELEALLNLSQMEVEVMQ